MNTERERRRFATPPPDGAGPPVAEQHREVPVSPTPEELARIVQLALAEDLGKGDLTSEAVVPAQARCRAELVFEERGVVCGLAVAQAVFAELDPAIAFEQLVPEGAALAAPGAVARLEGRARAVLGGERTALNLVARLSGIATLTARYVDAVAGTGVTLLDTRKTTPGLRPLERYAVRCGGAANHRSGLYDAILLKENHLRLAGGIQAALAACARHSALPVEVEAETLDEVAEALTGGAERILLDNMSPTQVREAVALVDGRALLEASGGITLATVRAYAETGVDLISVGALTRSVPALDVSLEVA